MIFGPPTLGRSASGVPRVCFEFRAWKSQGLVLSKQWKLPRVHLFHHLKAEALIRGIRSSIPENYIEVGVSRGSAGGVCIVNILMVVAPKNVERFFEGVPEIRNRGPVWLYQCGQCDGEIALVTPVTSFAPNADSFLDAVNLLRRVDVSVRIVGMRSSPVWQCVTTIRQ